MKYILLFLMPIFIFGFTKNSTEVDTCQNEETNNNNFELKSSDNIDFGPQPLNLDAITEGNDTYVIFYKDDGIIQGMSGIFNSLISLPQKTAVVDKVDGGIKFTYSDATCDVFGVANQLKASQINGCTLKTSGIGVSLYPLYKQSERLHIDTLYAQYHPSTAELEEFIVDFYNFAEEVTIDEE